MRNVAEKVDSSIQWLVRDFSQTPNKYLTEDDVRMHLCSRLIEHFGSVIRTQDGDESIPLHSEVRWWGPDGRKDRTDIVIFDVSGLSVTKDVVGGLFKFGQIPKKGYASNTPLAAIELKFRRNDGASDKAFIASVKADIHKLKGLHTMMNEVYSKDLVCRVAALDKKNIINESHFSEPPVVMFYQFANISAVAQQVCSGPGEGYARF